MEKKIEKELLAKVLRSFTASFSGCYYQHGYSVSVSIDKATAHVMKKFTAPEKAAVSDNEPVYKCDEAGVYLFDKPA